jgi:hypothetical protein
MQHRARELPRLSGPVSRRRTVREKKVLRTGKLATRAARHPFLAGMSETNLSRLIGCDMTRHFRKGETILREGRFANRQTGLLGSSPSGLSVRAHQPNGRERLRPIWVRDLPN